MDKIQLGDGYHLLIAGDFETKVLYKDELQKENDMRTDEHDNGLFEEDLLSLGRIETSSKVTNIFDAFSESDALEGEAYMDSYFPKNTFNEFMEVTR